MSPKRTAQTKLPRLIVISAPSGAGKTTLCEMLLKEYPQIALSISATTRKARPFEKDGLHYFFVDEAEFQRKVERGEFAEWAEVHGRRYGTLKTTIERHLAEGKHILFDIDVQGAMSLKTLYPERALLIFIHPPSLETLKERLVQRKGDSAGSIETRLQNAYAELGWSKKFDYEITNDELQVAYSMLRTIVARECL